MAAMFSTGLCVARLAARSAEDVIAALAEKLERAGFVRPSFAAAAVARERRSPTGLPFEPPLAVALPHAEPEHVIAPAIAIATLAAAVSFREMGSPGSTVDARIVVMPALTAKEQAAAWLARLIEILQDDAVRAELVGATTAEALCAILSARWAP